MTNITIDSERKRISIELDLKGEPAPLKAEIKSYDLSSADGKSFIALGKIVTSREWLNLLLNDYLPLDKRRFEVPAAVKVLL